VFFGTAQSEDGTVTSQGVYAYNVESQVLTQVLSQGFDLQDVSPDGTQLLVNAENHLFTLNLTDGSTELVSDSFMFYGEQGAYWNTAGSEPIYLDQSNPISTENGEAFNLFPSPQTDGLIFESGNCTSKDYCESEGVFFRDSEGNISQLTGYQQPIYSPDGSRIAFLDPTDATSENYYHIDRLLAEETSLGSASRRILFFPAEPGFMVYPDVEDYAFSPDSSQLLILYNVYSEYYEKSLKLQTYLWDLDIGILYDFGVLEGVSGSLNPRFTWSPDGQKLLFFLTELTDEGEYIIRVYTTDLETGEKLTLTGDPLFTGENYFYITNLYWR
jgi:Tol biopolymer transport system component